jgi:hypothetical protein
MRLLALLAATALCAATHVAEAASATFTTIDNPGDPTFNQLLGITDNGTVVGYFGSGWAGHPNQAYSIAPPYTAFTSQNVPGAVQTQAIGVNGSNIVGFWSGTNNGPGQDANYGFFKAVKTAHAQYTVVNGFTPNVPTTAQLLGVNAAQNAAGFYVDGNGISHGFVYGLSTYTYTQVLVSGAKQVMATGINANNLVCGAYTDAKGVTHGFLQPLGGGTTVTFSEPGAQITQFLGVNTAGEAVGFYQLTPNDITHGILYNPANGTLTQLDEPNGVGGTVINGLNNKGQAVGFYTDAAGNVHGMIINNAF